MIIILTGNNRFLVYLKHQFYYQLMHYHIYCFLFYLHRQNTVLVSADDIIITSMEQTDDGLQLTFFVRGGSGDTSGVITAEAVLVAVRVSTTIAQDFIIMKRIYPAVFQFDQMLVF